jgi:hypothetical protein
LLEARHPAFVEAKPLGFAQAGPSRVMLSLNQYHFTLRSIAKRCVSKGGRQS